MNAGEIVTIKRIAELLDVSVRTVRRYIHDPDHPLPCFQPTRKTILVRLADFEVWLEASRREGRPEARKELDRMLQARRPREQTAAATTEEVQTRRGGTA
jgi:excisionase family DNA binding protein